MRKPLQVLTLVLALSVTALAGDMQCPIIDTPAQPSTNVTQEPTTGGEMPNDVADSMTQIALDLLAVLPSLL